MTRPELGPRTILLIDDGRFEVNGSTNIQALRGDIEDAVAAGGRFVDFTLVDDQFRMLAPK